MSRTKTGKRSSGGKGCGYEFWKSRLGKGYEDPGPETKDLTHKKERRAAKRQLDDVQHGRVGTDAVRVDRP